VGDGVTDGRPVFVGLEVGERVGEGLDAESAVWEGVMVEVVCVGNTMVGGSVGSGAKYASNLPHPVITSRKIIVMNIFLRIVEPS
jgi:hypothetical protein